MWLPNGVCVPIFMPLIGVPGKMSLSRRANPLAATLRLAAFWRKVCQVFKEWLPVQLACQVAKLGCQMEGVPALKSRLP